MLLVWILAIWQVAFAQPPNDDLGSPEYSAYCAQYTSGGKRGCRKAQGDCQLIANECRPKGIKPCHSIDNPKACGKSTAGRCIYDDEADGGDGACVTRDIPADCQPCVGYPQEACAARGVGERQCRGAFTTKEGVDGYCVWVGYMQGYGCQSDWLRCDEVSAEGEKQTFKTFCNEETQGHCEWDDGEDTESTADDTCMDKDYPECTPCYGGGVCDTMDRKEICTSSFGRQNGCEWKGWKKGNDCGDVVRGYQCSSVGDPHIHIYEWGAENFNFMGVGEYWMVDCPTLQVQVRQQVAKKERISTNLAIAWFGPEFSCNKGRNVCSNTCGLVYELHAGNRFSQVSLLPVGGEEYDPTLIIRDPSDGSYVIHEGFEDIKDALHNSCDQQVAGTGQKFRTPDTVLLEFRGDKSFLKLQQWVRPAWGLGVYHFARDRGGFSSLDPAATGYRENLCTSDCNYLECGHEDNLFSYYANPSGWETEESFISQYAGAYRPVRDKITLGNSEGWCSRLQSTRCEKRTLSVDDCPQDLRDAAEDLCQHCDAKTQLSCVFDACAAEDIKYAEEYEDSCKDQTPVAPPVLPPTPEPTSPPRPPPCGAIFSDVCQVDSWADCGARGGYLHKVKKKTKYMFQIFMPPSEDVEVTTTTNPCSCEQFCMVKGGDYWMFGETDILYQEEVIKKGRVKSPRLNFMYCKCFNKKAAKIKYFSGDATNKKVKKNLKKGLTHFAGEVLKQVLDKGYDD